MFDFFVRAQRAVLSGSRVVAIGNGATLRAWRAVTSMGSRVSRVMGLYIWVACTATKHSQHWRSHASRTTEVVSLVILISHVSCWRAFRFERLSSYQAGGGRQRVSVYGQRRTEKTGSLREGSLGENLFFLSRFACYFVVMYLPNFV